MTPEEFQTLSVFDAVAVNSRASQRELSRATGLNVAKVNHLLRKMVEKGFVKLRTVSKSPSKLGYLYVLTPRGLAEKSRLTVRFASRTWKQYSEAIVRFRENLRNLAAGEVTEVALVGANEVAQMIIEASRDVPEVEIVGVVDPGRAGGTKHGVRIFAHLDEVDHERAIVCNDEDLTLGELAKKTGIKKEKLWLV